MDTITVIVPCYNEEQALPYYHAAIKELREKGLDNFLTAASLRF